MPDAKLNTRYQGLPFTIVCLLPDTHWGDSGNMRDAVRVSWVRAVNISDAEKKGKIDSAALVECDPADVEVLTVFEGHHYDKSLL